MFTASLHLCPLGAAAYPRETANTGSHLATPRATRLLRIKNLWCGAKLRMIVFSLLGG